MKYNVFISSKSEDYHLAEQVYNFLKQKGLNVFLASRELDQIGEAQYANMIDEAIIYNSTYLKIILANVFQLDQLKSYPDIGFYLNKVQVSCQYEDIIQDEETFERFINRKADGKTPSGLISWSSCFVQNSPVI